MVLIQFVPNAETMPACIRWTNMFVASRFNVNVGSMVRCSMLVSMATPFSRRVLTTQKLAGETSSENRTLDVNDDWLEVGSMPS